MGYVTTKDNVDIFYKDWGPRDAQVIFFHHGWPLSADDWDAQMLFFLAHGYRVVAHDRRGHGRSSQVPVIMLSPLDVRVGSGAEVRHRSDGRRLMNFRVRP